jgi:hypothetical protein
MAAICSPFNRWAIKQPATRQCGINQRTQFRMQRCVALGQPRHEVWLHPDRLVEGVDQQGLQALPASEVLRGYQERSRV